MGDEGVREGWTPTADLRMYRQIHGGGDGHPALLIHGGGETIEACWGGLLPWLSADRTVVAVEEEGHGRTRATERPLASEASARDVVAVLDDLGIETVDVVAFSAGGQTALALAIAAPERIRRLVLLSVPWRRDAMVDGFWDGLFASSLADMPQQFQDAYLALNPGDVEGLRRFFDLDSRRMLTFADVDDAAIRGIRSPALVVAGDRDVVTVDSARRLADELPDGRLLILPAAHGDYLGDDPQLLGLFAPFVVRFLEG